MNKITQDNYMSIDLYGQQMLPLDSNPLFEEIENDEFFQTYIELLQDVDLPSYFLKAKRENQTIDDCRLLATIIYAYTTVPENLSLRKLEWLCKTNIFFLWLTDFKKPSHQAFFRCIHNLKENAIVDLNHDLTALIAQKMGYSIEDLYQVVYIDGTKIKANANRFTYVRKKQILNAMEKKDKKITEKINEINEDESIDLPFRLPTKEKYEAVDLVEDCWMLHQIMEERKIGFIYGRGHRKTPIQRALDILATIAQAYMTYEFWLEIIGPNRNSCSKTDLDATFMRTKWDYYNATGLYLACYNLQIAVSGCEGLVVECGMFQNPSDTPTYIPFMEAFLNHWGSYPKRVVADAAYGTHKNYRYNLEKGIESFMKHNHSDDDIKPKYRKKIYERYNWKKDVNGHYVCPQGRAFSEIDPSGTGMTVSYGVECFRVQMREPDHCQGCPVCSQCAKSASGERKISFCPEAELYREMADELLSTPEGLEMLNLRKIIAEGTFGNIKSNHDFDQLNYRTFPLVIMETNFQILGNNLRKLRTSMEKQKKYEKKNEQLIILDAAPVVEQCSLF